MKKLFSILFFTFAITTNAQKYESINDSLFSVAGELRSQAKYQESIDVLKKISKYSAEGNKATLEVARNYYIDKKYDLALENIKKIDKSLLNNELLHDYYIIWANILDDSDKSKEAIKIYDDAIKSFPDSYLFYYDRAVAHVGEKNKEAAVKDLMKSIEIYPNYYRSHYLLGTIAIENGNMAEGIMAVTTSILFDANDNITLSALKMLNYELAKKFEEPTTKLNFEGSELFAGINNAVIKQFALGKGYKLQTDLDISYIRQLQAVLSELPKITTKKGFFANRYVDFYTKIWTTKQFEIFSYRLFQNFDSPDVQKLILKRKNELSKFNDWMFYTLMETNSQRKVNFNGKEEFVSVLSEDEYIGYGKFENGKRNGFWRYNYSNGNKFLEGNYKNAELDGLVTTYFQNGNLMRKSNYKLGKLNGKVEYFNILGNQSAVKDFLNDVETNNQQFFYPFGGKKQTYTIKNGKADGKEESFYENGNIKSTSNYLMGDSHGDFKEFYVDGTLKKSAKYVRNKYNGEVIEYYQNKNIYTKENYQNGNIFGEYIKNYPNNDLYNMYKIDAGNASYVKSMEGGQIDDERFFEGNKLVRQKIYLNNKVVLEYAFEGKDGFEHISSYKTFDANGTQVAETKIKTNTPFVVKLANGNKYLEGTYNNKGQKHGEFKYYNLVTGLLSTKANFDKNSKVGKQEEFYPNGAIRVAYEMKNDKKNGKYNTFFKDGTVSRACNYVNDNLEGENINYYKNGKIKNISFYENDDINGGIIERYSYNGELEQVEQYLGKELHKVTYHSKYAQPLVVDFNKQGPIKIMEKGPNEIIESTIKNGQHEGQYFIKNNKGQKIFEAKLINGLKYGESISYNPNGTILSKATNLDNQLYGEFVKNNLDGKFYWKTNYLNDSEYGVREKFFHEGFKYLSYSYYNDNQQGKEIYYSDKGEELLTINYINDNVYSYQLPEGKEEIVKNGNLNLVVNFKGTTKPALEIGFKNGLSEGVFKYYHTNGQVLIQNDYTNGSLQKKQWFYSTGKPYLYEELKDNDNHGKLNMYYPNGNIKIETNYVNDDLHGTYKEYDQNGKLIINQVYDFDTLVENK